MSHDVFFKTGGRFKHCLAHVTLVFPLFNVTLFMISQHHIGFISLTTMAANVRALNFMSEHMLVEMILSEETLSTDTAQMFPWPIAVRQHVLAQRCRLIECFITHAALVSSVIGVNSRMLNDVLFGFETLSTDTA